MLPKEPFSDTNWHRRIAHLVPDPQESRRNAANQGGVARIEQDFHIVGDNGFHFYAPKLIEMKNIFNATRSSRVIRVLFVAGMRQNFAVFLRNLLELFLCQRIVCCVRTTRNAVKHGTKPLFEKDSF